MILDFWNRKKKNHIELLISNIEMPSIEWNWSAHLGGYERHLQRRWNNPLFPVAQRKITAEDVYLARKKDETAINSLRQQVANLHLTWPDELPVAYVNWCHAMREKVDELSDSYYKVGGDASVLKMLQQMRHCVIETWKAGLKNNSEGLAALEHAEIIRAEWSYLDNIFVRQSTNEEYIPQTELIPALLSEPTENIRAYCQFITHGLNETESQKKLTILQNIFLDFIGSVKADLLGQGEKIPNWNDKLEALGVNGK